MVDSLRAGLVDGFCVGEPWNSLAAAQGLGRIVATQSQLFPRAVEKVLAVRATLAGTERLTRLLQALDAAAEWVDHAPNHAAVAAQLARPDYLGVPEESIAAALDGRLRLGLGAAKRDVDFMYFHRYAANAPRAADGLWAYAQMVRWGQLAPSAVAQRAAAEVFRPDLYCGSVPAAALAAPALTPFDGIEFVATDVPAYLDSFDVHTSFADTHSL
jgi:NitT/TauT family transport system ATP-binding protein